MFLKNVFATMVPSISDIPQIPSGEAHRCQDSPEGAGGGKSLKMSERQLVAEMLRGRGLWDLEIWG